MLQGTQRKIIFLKSTKSKHFDEAYLVLKDDITNYDEKEILLEAERIIFNVDYKRKKRKKRISFKGAFLFSTGALLATLISCLGCIILH